MQPGICGASQVEIDYYIRLFFFAVPTSIAYEFWYSHTCFLCIRGARFAAFIVFEVKFHP